MLNSPIIGSNAASGVDDDHGDVSISKVCHRMRQHCKGVMLALDGAYKHISWFRVRSALDDRRISSRPC